MAKASKVIDPEGQYRVTLSKPAMLGRRMLRPRDDVVIKGKLIAELGDAVEKFEEV